ncbi:uncharacterized protein LOC134283984 [Aedes albopictus]|uniref:Integrase zinc-binding domain-containing protein n=1 Tax=Aedes albopictus TaxID=7160 RepID=A0ABM1YV75_AEDAL
MTLLPPSADRLTEEFAQLQERMERLQQKLRSASNHADPPATSIPKSQPLMSQGLPTSRSQHLLVPPLQYQPIRSQPAITWNPRLFASTRTSTLPSRTETPFLELQAAVIGARLARTVMENHSLKIAKRVLWTDSSTVLSWLRSDVRKYRQFVAHRVSEILDLTTVDEWRWIPTRLNVADDATKWGKGPQIDESSRWFRAPDFLYYPPDTWPLQDTPVPSTVEEIRPVHVHREVSKFRLIDFGRFSKWERMLRSIAYVHKFISVLRQRIEGESTTKRLNLLSQDDLVKAEMIIWKQIQLDQYAVEIVKMRRNQQLPPNQREHLDRNSKLRQISPYLDEHGVVRMESRIANAVHFTRDFKYPVILPKDHPGTMLVIDWYHRQYQHHSNETVVNEMKQRYHVSRLREVLKKVKKNCMWCKVHSATPKVPRMAPLPVARITPHVRAFTYTGVDYFGPLLIKQGRSDVKRWVALFTCLTIRAVHLEPLKASSKHNSEFRCGNPNVYLSNNCGWQESTKQSNPNSM